jgi:hypothetical protein
MLRENKFKPFLNSPPAASTRRWFLWAQLVCPMVPVRSMRILFDHGTPSGIVKALSGHEATEAIERGWDRTSNGELLELAEAEGFELLLTTDKRIRYQQNLHGRKIAIVVLGNSTWRVVRLYLDRIASAVNETTPGSYTQVDIPFK